MNAARVGPSSNAGRSLFCAPAEEPPNAVAVRLQRLGGLPRARQVDQPGVEQRSQVRGVRRANGVGDDLMSPPASARPTPSWGRGAAQSTQVDRRSVMVIFRIRGERSVRLIGRERTAWELSTHLGVTSHPPTRARHRSSSGPMRSARRAHAASSGSSASSVWGSVAVGGMACTILVRVGDTDAP